jgi:hypothetical protein
MTNKIIYPVLIIIFIILIIYGIFNLKDYANALLNNHNSKKDNNIICLPMDNNTNMCRKKLPILNRIKSCDMYNKIAISKFLISPIGDRDDCYRHYEAIGLGTIPISNAAKNYNFNRKEWMNSIIFKNLLLKLINNCFITCSSFNLSNILFNSIFSIIVLF